MNFGYLYSSLVFEERINSFSSFDEDHIKISIAEGQINRDLLTIVSLPLKEQKDKLNHFMSL